MIAHHKISVGYCNKGADSVTNTQKEIFLNT